MQEFDLEIKDKKGSDNVITSHLSRMEKPTKEERGTKIEENFPDEQLFQVSVQTPWYADIVNFLACGLMPPEFNYQQRRKLRTDAKFYIWDDPLPFRRGAYQIIRDVYQRQNKLELWIDVIHHHMENTLQETEQLRKFSSQVFIGQLCLKIVMNGSNIVTVVREWAIIIE